MTKNTVKIIFSFLVISLSVFLLLKFRSIPVSRIWSDYTVFYYPSSQDESRILDYFYREGCSGIICTSTQKAPVVSPVTPVLPDSFSDYLQSRLSYFSDKSGKYSLVYIPRKYSEKASSAVLKIKALVDDCGLEGKAGIPWLCIAAVAVFYVFLLILSGFNMIFAFPGIFLILLAYSMPFYPVASGAVLLLLALFLARNLWNRRGALRSLFHNPFFVSLSTGALVSMFFTSPAAFIFSSVTLAAIIASYVLMESFIAAREEKYSFHFDLIFSSRQIALVNYKNNWNLLAAGAAVLFIAAAFIFTSSGTSPSLKDSMLLPSPVQDAKESSGELPGLEDFYQWSWQCLTFPYKNLNDDDFRKKPQRGDSLVIPRYASGAREIVEYDETVRTFDNDFIKEQNREILKDENPVIERLLLSEGCSSSYFSAVSGKSDNTHFGLNLVLILFCALISSGSWVYYKYFGRTK